MPPRSTALIVLALSVPLLGTACSTSQAASPGAPGGAVTAIGAENEYANVISQLGGTYVRVSAILSNPNTDPHTFESSASVTQEVSGAQLIVQNGVGYDSFMNKIEAAAPSSARTVIDVQNLLRLPDSTPNPHLWYSPSTMPAVAKAITAALSRLQPAHAAFFAASLRRFDASLQPWYQAIAQFKAAYPGTPVATTEPVADYLLQAAGTRNLTPFPFQADIMNGVDPVTPGRLPPGQPLLRPQGQSVPLQPAGHRHAHRIVPHPGQEDTASRSSASTRPCPPPATTTRRGCSPKSPRCGKPSPARSPPRSYDQNPAAECRHQQRPRRMRSRSVCHYGRRRDPERAHQPLDFDGPCEPLAVDEPAWIPEYSCGRPETVTCTDGLRWTWYTAAKYSSSRSETIARRFGYGVRAEAGRSPGWLQPEPEITAECA